jgi:hypothetical protein
VTVELPQDLAPHHVGSIIVGDRGDARRIGESRGSLISRIHLSPIAVDLGRLGPRGRAGRRSDMNCKTCRSAYRTGAMAYVVDEKGNLVRARVCKTCAGTAIRLVVTAAKAACACGAAPETCAKCVATRVEAALRQSVDAKGVARAPRKKAKAYGVGGADEFSAGIQEGSCRRQAFLSGAPGRAPIRARWSGRS